MTLKKILKENSKSIAIAKETIKDIARVPSGVFIFDALTGGGIPLWKISIFHGVKSSGKTTQGLRVMGNFLELYPNKSVAYIDFEQSFDVEWASNFIEEDALERIYVVTPDYGEEGIDLAVALCKEEEIGMLFVDSLAMIIPTADATNSAMDDTMGSHAKLVNKLFRKIIPVISNARKEDRPFTCLLVNQFTSNYSATKFGSSVKKPGGMLQDFINFLDVRFYFIRYETKGEAPIAGVYNIKIEKAKIKGAFPHAKGEFKMALVDKDGYKVGEPKDEETILSYAKRVGVLEREGNTWKFNENIFKNKAEVLAKMYNDIHFTYALGDATLRKIYDTGLLGGNNDDD